MKFKLKYQYLLLAVVSCVSLLHWPMAVSRRRVYSSLFDGKLPRLLSEAERAILPGSEATPFRNSRFRGRRDWTGFFQRVPTQSVSSFHEETFFVTELNDNPFFAPSPLPLAGS
jgi:hypothetical protein